MSKTSKNINIDNLTQPEGKNSQPNSLRGGESKIMKRFTKKAINVMTTAALLASLSAPVVNAQSENSVDRVIYVSSDYNFNGNNTPFLTIKEKSAFPSDFRNGDTFRLVLPSGVKWNNGIQATVTADGVSVSNGATVTKISDTILEVRLNTADGQTDNPESPDVDSIQIPMDINVDGYTGEIKVKVEARDSGVTSGEYTIAVSSSGKTITTVDDVKTIGKSGIGGTIRIDETNIGALYGYHEITLKLPSGYEWNLGNNITQGTNLTNLDINPDNNVTQNFVSFGGDFSGSTATYVDGNGTRTLKFRVNLNNGQATTTRGSIYIVPAVKVDDASPSDVVVSISSSSISDQNINNGAAGVGSITSTDVTVAKYADWGVTAKVEEVKEIVAGKVDEIKTAKITLEETVLGSIIGGRSIDIEFPEWVKVVGVPNGDFTASGNVSNASVGTVDGTKSKFSININNTAGSSTKGKIEFKVQLSVQANKSGDIEAKISGAGIDETKLVVAKAVPAISAESVKAADVKVGLQDQNAPDFVIIEGVKEALERSVEDFASQANNNVLPTTSLSSNGQVTVTLPAGVSFSSTPTVEVIDGNLEIVKESVSRNSVNGGVNNQLVFTIKSESTKPSKIKVSNVKLTVDRTVPEGKIEASIGGSAIVENNGTGAGEFNTGTAAKFVIANTVTPAPGESISTAKFTIGSNTYVVNGEEKVLDVAPYIENGRTFLPVRFVAEAVGVTDDNILVSYDPKSGKVVSVTLIKGDRIAKITIGSKVLTVNGVDLTMDVAAQIKNGRTVLPLRHVATALGANIDWDDATDTVTVESK